MIFAAYPIKAAFPVTADFDWTSFGFRPGMSGKQAPVSAAEGTFKGLLKDEIGIF